MILLRSRHQICQLLLFTSCSAMFDSAACHSILPQPCPSLFDLSASQEVHIVEPKAHHCLFLRFLQMGVILRLAQIPKRFFFFKMQPLKKRRHDFPAPLIPASSGHSAAKIRGAGNDLYKHLVAFLMERASRDYSSRTLQTTRTRAWIP